MIKLHTTNTHTKLEGIIFWPCNSKKEQVPTAGDADTFLKHDFWHFQLPYIKTNDIFWKPKTKLDKIGMFCNEIIKMSI